MNFIITLTIIAYLILFIICKAKNKLLYKNYLLLLLLLLCKFIILLVIKLLKTYNDYIVLFIYIGNLIKTDVNLTKYDIQANTIGRFKLVMKSMLIQYKTILLQQKINSNSYKELYEILLYCFTEIYATLTYYFNVREGEYYRYKYNSFLNIQSSYIIKLFFFIPYLESFNINARLLLIIDTYFNYSFIFLLIFILIDLYKLLHKK